MSRRYHFPALAWAGVEPKDIQLLNYWFQHSDRPRRRCNRRDEVFEQDFGERFRNRRGDIKFILLELLAEQPRHGYDLIKAIEERFGGFRRLSPGSVYPTLQMLEEGGFLTSEMAGSKRVYSITDAGRELLAERGQGRTSNPISDNAQELTNLRRSISELSGAVKQAAQSGNGERIGRVRELLDRVKREIYTLLAEE